MSGAIVAVPAALVRLDAKGCVWWKGEPMSIEPGPADAPQLETALARSIATLAAVDAEMRAFVEGCARGGITERSVQCWADQVRTVITDLQEEAYGANGGGVSGPADGADGSARLPEVSAGWSADGRPDLTRR